MQVAWICRGVLCVLLGWGMLVVGVGVPSKVCKTLVVLQISEGVVSMFGHCELARSTWT